MMWSGKHNTTNNKSNILKLMHTLIKSQGSTAIKDMYNEYLLFFQNRHLIGKNGVPFLENAVKKSINFKYNKKLFNKFGYLTQPNFGNLVQINDSIIYSVETIMEHHLTNNIYRKPLKYDVTFSQKKLFV